MWGSGPCTGWHCHEWGLLDAEGMIRIWVCVICGGSMLRSKEVMEARCGGRNKLSKVVVSAGEVLRPDPMNTSVAWDVLQIVPTLRQEVWPFVHSTPLMSSLDVRCPWTGDSWEPLTAITKAHRHLAIEEDGGRCSVSSTRSKHPNE